MDSPKARTKKTHWFSGTTAVDKEELNTVEFPLALLARQIPKTLQESKRLEFKDSITDQSTGETIDRNLVISANADSELPNYWDQDALVALQVLTGRKHQWTSEVVEFTLYEVLKLMRLADDGPNCRRLAKSLDNWQGIRFKYSHWREGDQWVQPKAFGIIQDYDLTRRSSSGQFQPERPQTFAWARRFYESVRASNTKPFDADFYFGLKLPTSRRLFRFGDKRLYSRPVFSKPIVTFCEDKLGMCPGQKPSKLQKSLTPAYDELVVGRFLADLKPEKRFTRKDGVLYVNFRRGPGRKNRSQVAVSSKLLPSHEQALIDRGCNATKVAELVRDDSVSVEQMKLVIEWFDWEMERKTEIPNPGGWLYKSCKENWGPPKDFKTLAQREEEQKKKAKRLRQQAEAEAKEKAERERQRIAEREALERFQSCRNSMTELERVALEDKAMESVDGFMREQVLRARRKGEVGMFHQMLWEKHIMPNMEASLKVQPESDHAA